MPHHWVEWDVWDSRTRRYAVLEKKIIFEKNKKNGTVNVFQATQSMLDSIKRDIEKWNQTKGVYDKDELWKPEVKILDTVTSRTKIFEIIGNNGELISFGHAQFEITFSIKLPK